MKLIGAGFGRTGTMSLKAALEQIGYGPCFHMIDLIKDPTPLPYWRAAAAGEEVDWEEALDGWESTIDWPACTYWEEHVRVWPDLPVLLSVRDPDSWYESTAKSIAEAADAGTKGELKGGTVPPPNPEVMETINRQIWDGTFEGRFEDRDFTIGKYHEHNEAVKAGVPEDRLLVFDVNDGWGPLCSFLGVDEPDSPFPHLNDRDSFRAMMGLPALS